MHSNRCQRRRRRSPPRQPPPPPPLYILLWWLLWELSNTQTHSNVSALSRARGEREKERKRTKLFSLDNGTHCDHHHRYHNRNGHQSFWRLHTLSSFSGIFTCSLILLHTLSTIFHHHYFFFYYFFFSPFSPFRFALVCARVARQKTQPKQTDSSLSVSVFSVRVLASSEVEAV